MYRALEPFPTADKPVSTAGFGVSTVAGLSRGRLETVDDYLNRRTEGRTMTVRRAREALESQGFKTPGPKLIEEVLDAIGREEEGQPPGVRIHKFDYAELLADTPELVDRTQGPLTDPATATSTAIADVLNKAIAYVFDDDEEPDS